jgi:hypothetical protein
MWGKLVAGPTANFVVYFIANVELFIAVRQGPKVKEL